MAVTFVGKTRLGIDATYKNTTDLTTAVESPGLEWPQTWSSGSGSNQGNRYWSDSRSAAGAADNLDLYGGLTDVFGNTLNLAKVKGIYIKNKETTSGYKLVMKGNFVTGAMLDSWVDDALGIIIPVGGQWRMENPIDGWVVTQTTQDVLTLDPGANTVAYDIAIIGVQ